MADKIKGITIEFNGDTTKLDKALRNIKNETKSIDKSLKDVDRALKFNPKNTELLAQKQKLLKDRVDQTEKSLQDLKNVQQQLDDQGVDKQSEEYMRVRREIIETESKLKHYKAEQAKFIRESSRIHQVGQRFKEVGAKIEGAGQKLRGVSRAAAVVSAALVGTAVSAGKAADDINTLSKVTGISTDDLQMYAATADLVDVSVQDMAKAHQKLKKSMASDSNAKYFKQLGIETKNADGSLRDVNEVFDETIVALGKMENETERDAVAMAIMGRSATNLNPLIEDGGRTYEKVAKMMSKYGLDPLSQDQLDKANEFKDQLDTIKLLFLQAVRIVGSKIAGTLVPLMDKLVQKVAKVAEFMGKQNGKVLTTILAITSAVALLSPALIILGKVVSAVGTAIQTMTTVVGALSKAMAFLAANPIVLVIAGITALVAAFVILWKKSEKFRNFWINLWNGVKNAVSGVATFIKNTFGNMFAAIRSKFTGLGTALGNAISGAVKAGVNGVINRVETIINTAIALINSAITLANKLPGVNVGKVKALHLPRLAEGGILRHAQTVIAGEAGPEAIIPLDKLFKKMDEMSTGEITINVYGAAGQSVNELAAEVERRLVAMQKNRRMAWA